MGKEFIDTAPVESEEQVNYTTNVRKMLVSRVDEYLEELFLQEDNPFGLGPRGRIADFILYLWYTCNALDNVGADIIFQPSMANLEEADTQDEKDALQKEGYDG